MAMFSTSDLIINFLNTQSMIEQYTVENLVNEGIEKPKKSKNVINKILKMNGQVQGVELPAINYALFHLFSLCYEERIEHDKIKIFMDKLLSNKTYLNNIQHNINNDCFDTKDGATLLNLACEYGMKDVALKLIEAGANVNLQDADNNTPLHHIALCINEAIGKDINANLSTFQGITNLLVRQGANQQALNKDGKRPDQMITAQEKLPVNSASVSTVSSPISTPKSSNLGQRKSSLKEPVERKMPWFVERLMAIVKKDQRNF
ncbi:MAG: ankyrin repeat protein [Lentimonas sp.]|jgi:ankyrin repeat protein